MPRVSAFYGIVIWMYHDDHNPPHFHASYGEHWAVYGDRRVRSARRFVAGPERAALVGRFPVAAEALAAIERLTHLSA